MSYELPETDQDFIDKIQAEYSQAQLDGGEGLRHAQYRLAWSLVHSSNPAQVEQGIEMSRMLCDIETDSSSKREAEYYLAVGFLKSKSYVDAWRQVKAVLAEWPEFRQAEQLKGLIQERIIHEGVVGIGIAGATLLGAGAIAVAAALMRR
ncbi:hypothetical protein BSKO_09353 [Bryopsis sp. KO-2023]|nr:hypothetical protein BSKO_09353 [Bryopsis sp. KO-2023]